MLVTYLLRMPRQVKKWLDDKKLHNGSSINWQINKIMEAQMLKEKRNK